MSTTAPPRSPLTVAPAVSSSSPEPVAEAAAKIDVSNLDFYYGTNQVLFDVNLEIGEGEMVALLGTNGAGKASRCWRPRSGRYRKHAQLVGLGPDRRTPAGADDALSATHPSPQLPITSG